MVVTLISLLFFAGLARASIFCPHTVYPSTADSDEFVVASIQTRQRPGQEAYYRITDDTNDPAYKRNSSAFRLMTTRDSSECPYRGCLVELSPVEPKNHGTVLYQTSVIGKMIPPGFFAMDVARRLYCVVTDGDCGATIPLYRHYRLTPTGIYHAYSLESDVIIEGYIREPTPLCYVWSKEKPVKAPASDTPSTLIPPLTDIIEKLLPKSTSAPQKSSHSNEDNALIENDEFCNASGPNAFDSSMKKLREYHNAESGTKSDHWYTTKKPKSNYKQKAILGKIITNAKATNCKCLVQLVQMKFESDDKNVIDHKLARVLVEPISLYQYKHAGEELYCAHKENACGATVPLRKFYNLADSDSLLTAGSDKTPSNSVPSPSEVLCWIWPKNYHQESTEEEVRKENMNVVANKTREVSAEIIDGSGVEPEKDASKKSAEIVEKKTSKESVESREQIGGDKIVKFESVSTQAPKVTEKAVLEKDVLSSAEEKVNELVKFQSKHGKEPAEIEEQHDGASTILNFENIAQKQ